MPKLNRLYQIEDLQKELRRMRRWNTVVPFLAFILGCVIMELILKLVL